MTKPAVVKYVPNRTLAVWVAIVGFTLAMWVIGTEHSFSAVLVTASVLAIAFIKVRFIGSDFMELRHAPIVMARAFDGYLAAVYLGLMAMYVLM